MFKISGAINPGEPLNHMVPPGDIILLIPRLAIFTQTEDSSQDNCVGGEKGKEGRRDEGERGGEGGEMREKRRERI